MALWGGFLWDTGQWSARATIVWDAFLWDIGQWSDRLESPWDGFLWDTGRWVAVVFASQGGNLVCC